MVTLDELHRFAVETGIEADPRSKEQIEQELAERREAYEQLTGVRKERYDEDRLDNPFDDSKVLYGGGREVNRLAVGIDIQTPELLLIQHLNDNGADIDCALTHHPEGRALARLAGVMNLNVDVLHAAGIPVSQAEGVVDEAAAKVEQKLHATNHPRTPQAAALLDMPYMSLHTVTDNHAYRFTKEYVAEQEPYTLEELIDALLEIPEYQWALEYGVGPRVFAGQDHHRAGKVGVLGFTGGTDVGKELIDKMVDAGVDTLLAMHATMDEIDAAKEKDINVVSAGHMSSDSLGINLLLDRFEAEFGLEFVEIAGFKRVDR